MAITASTIIYTDFGKFKVCYHKYRNDFLVSFSRGNLSINTPIVRLHSACLFGEAFRSIHCDCDTQIAETMRKIQKHGNGVITYSYKKEGRGAGLEKKIKAMEIQRIEKCDTVEAFKKLGLKKADYRIYKTEIEALQDLKVSKNIMFLGGNPDKIKALKEARYNIKKILKFNEKNLSKLAKAEIQTKRKRMGYI